jgi:ribosome modulation factor
VGTERGDEAKKLRDQELREELETAWLRGFDKGLLAVPPEIEEREQIAADYAERVVGARETMSEQEGWRLRNGLRMAHWLPARLEAAYLRGYLDRREGQKAEMKAYAQRVLRAYGIDPPSTPSKDENTAHSAQENV